MILTTFAALLLAGIPYGEGDTTGNGPSEAQVEAAAQALQGAKDAKQKARGIKGEERVALLTKAAKTYEEVGSNHGSVKEVAAEAWFRAGEIYRTLRNFEESKRCFEAVDAHSSVTEFAARALAERGHLFRRIKEYDAAFDLYAQVIQRFPEERLEGVRALTWQGKVRILQDRLEEGHALLLQTSEQFPDQPVECIRAVDTVAVDWIEEGKIDEARNLVFVVPRTSRGIERQRGTVGQGTERPSEDEGGRTIESRRLIIRAPAFLAEWDGPGRVFGRGPGFPWLGPGLIPSSRANGLGCASGPHRRDSPRRSYGTRSSSGCRATRE